MENRIFLKIFLLMAFMAVFSCLVSCSKEKSKPLQNGETEFFSFEAVDVIDESKPDVYVVLKVMTGDYWQSIIQGTKDAAAEYDCNLYIGGVQNELDWKIQENLLYEACEKGADAIIFAPTNSSVFSKTTADIHDAGVPLILIDTTLTSGTYDICFMTDNFQAGELAAESLLSMLENKDYSHDEPLQVAIQTTTKNSQTIVDRIAGFNKYWFKNAPANWTIIDDVKTNNGNIDLAIMNGKEFLDEYPDLKAVVACNNSSSVGFAQALKDEGRTDIVLSAFDYSDIVAEMIADSSWIVATVVQKQYDMGYLGVQTALDIISGSPVEYKFVDTGVMVINEGNYIEYENET